MNPPHAKVFLKPASKVTRYSPLPSLESSSKFLVYRNLPWDHPRKYRPGRSSVPAARRRPRGVYPPSAPGADFPYCKDRRFYPFCIHFFLLQGGGAQTLSAPLPRRAGSLAANAYACSLGPRTGTSIGFPGALTFAVMNACILAMCSSLRCWNRSCPFMYSLTGLYVFGMCW
jgi:hypothetical protein